MDTEGRERRCVNDAFQVSIWRKEWTVDSFNQSVLKRKRKFLDRESLIFYVSPVDFERLIKVQVKFKETIGLRNLKLRKD